jgi:hypothetical protein
MLSVKKCNFVQLFKKGNFVIPTYQRGYVWQKNEWEYFYNDALNIVKLKKYKTKHFMGNVLLMKKNNEYEIIDGQQRLITILLFIKAFESVYSNIRVTLKKERINKIFRNNLTANDTDGIFLSIMNGTFSEMIATTNNSSSNIKNAYLYFKNKINNNGRPLFKKNIKTDYSIYRMLLKLLFIEILIDSNSNPYLIFETLNARGVDLNISDLVKNHLVEKANDKQFVTDSWRRFTDGLNEDKFEELFQYFYNSNNNKKRLLKEITGNIDTDDNVREFISKLSLYVQIYKDLSDVTKTYPTQGVQEHISYLNHLESSLFKILAVPAQEKFSNSEFLKLLKLCEVFIFRYLVISKKDEKSFRKYLFKIAQKINKDEVTTANQVYNLLYKDFFVEDEEFENAFSYIRLVYSKKREYEYNNQGVVVKYLLYRLENYLRDEILLSLIGTQTNDVSIEHIENDSSINMPDAFKYRLGNYALMKESDNNRAGLEGLQFLDKKTRFYQISTYLTIIGGEKNNKQLSALSSYALWNKDNIKNRQRQMAKLAVDLWSLDGRQFVLDVPND